MKTNQILTNDMLRRYAPSIFAERAYECMSNKYTFMPTIQVADRLRTEGFQPVALKTSRTSIEGKRDFVKHELRFQDWRNGCAPVKSHLGQLLAEVILTNSHDGSSAYTIDAGLKRLVCMNGMTVSTGAGAGFRVRHIGGNTDDVIEAAYEVIESFPRTLEAAENFHGLMLTAPQQLAYADAALALRYDDAPPVTPEQLIQPQRTADFAPTLWNTFNVVQEKLQNGGVRSQASRRRTRAVTGINESSRLNKALWTLTEKMASLVSNNSLVTA